MFGMTPFKNHCALKNYLPYLEGSSEDHLVPMLVTGLHGYHVTDVSCGSGDAHSLALADDGKLK